MSKTDRRAALEALPAAERRGLWFEIKRARAIEHNKTRTNRSEYMDRATRRAPVASAPSLTEGGAFGASTNSYASAEQGTIQYDSGAFDTTFGGGSIIGNRFNTANGNPLSDTVVVDTIQAVVAQGGAFTTSSAGFVLLGPQTTGGGAQALFSTFTSASGPTDTVTFNPAVTVTGGSFFVLFADFNNSYVPVFGPGTNASQGYHGVHANTGGMGPNITAVTDLPSLNAFIRATGQLLPVELMEFKVE